MKKEFSNIEIIQIVDEIEKYFKENVSDRRLKFSNDTKWFREFPERAGVYAIYEKNKLVYFGETANLNGRMKDLKNTYNHTFRKKLGKKLFPTAKIKSIKFDDETENSLNEYFIKNIAIAYKEVSFGRTEIEEHLIYRNRNNGIYNSLSKRNKVHTFYDNSI